MESVTRSRFKGWSVVHRTTDNLDWPGWAVTGDGPLADGLGCVTRLHAECGLQQGHCPRMFKMRTSSMIASMAAVVVAGSANAAIVWSGVQSPAATDPSSLVVTPNGSFFSDSTLAYDANNNPLFVAYGNFGFSSAQGFYTDATTLQGMNDDGASGSFLFQIYGTVAGSGTSNRRVVSNSFGASISGLTGTVAHNATSGTGFGLANGSGSYNPFVLNSNANSGAAQGQFYNASGYIGFRFSTDGGTSWFFGWAKWTGGTDGTGALSEWAYNDTAGGSITAGQVPAPGVLALLGAAGLVGSRRRR
jgi:MYXO-CTERM domain-containing protein